MSAAPDVGAVADPRASFGQPAPVIFAEFPPGCDESMQIDDPTLSEGMLRMLFKCDSDIYSTERGAVEEHWSRPQKDLTVTSLNTTPELVGLPGDPLRVYFASLEIKKGKTRDLFTARWDVQNDNWTDLEEVLGANEPGAADVSPTVAVGVDPPILFFGSDRVGERNDIFQCTLQTPGECSAPTRLAELDTGGYEGDPWVNASATVLYFAKRPAGASLDIWVATRNDSNASFNAPARVGGLDTPDREADPWLSTDLRTIYFSSDRTGTWQIYSATR